MMYVRFDNKQIKIKRKNKMSEQYHTHLEQTSRERAMALGQAAHEVGGVSVQALGNEGDTFHNKRGLEVAVKQGNMLLRVSGMVGNLEPFRDRTNEIIAQQQADQQKPPTQVA